MYSEGLTRNESADAEDEGHKWTLGALLRKLQSSGIDTNLLMVRVEDVILKALFSVQGQIAAACKNVVPYSKCCFELFGFDVLIDASLKPWLLEVNLSPSLTCDSPLDLQLKSSLVCDVLTLAAIPLNARKFAENQHTKTGLMSGALKRMRYRSKERSMFITQRLKKKSLRCLSPSLSPSKFRKNSRECVRKSLEQWKMESNRLGAFLPLFPRGNSFLVYRCIMEEYDIINWDACLFEGIHGDKFSQDLDKETVKLVHQELMDCENITNTSALSNSVLQVLMPSLKMAEKYLSRMTTPGVKYAKKLPKLRPELCKRSGSFEESKRKARLVSNDDDIIFTTTSQIDRANFDRIPLDEKPSSKVPLTELSQTTDVKASAGQSEVEKKISEGSDPNENAEPILPMQNY
ncbi:unnamed protein product [Thelazia callipaeda]|uniref:Tubulin--tyrosine ligase-like protein 5 n=1 Tax=Thelazia callipaeda TaxID=103827 RepID=A0A0N5CQR6_THECL|nr:unnamed protein product [Thelazia callipaeda]